MSNNIVSDAMWWLRSRDKSALAFAGILVALLLVLLIYAANRGGGDDAGSEFLVTDFTPTAQPVFTPTPIAVATVAPTASLPTPVPTMTPTPAITTDDLVTGADNADQLATPTAEAAPAATAVPTTTPIPAASSPAPTAVPAAVPAATATATATPGVVGTATPRPTPCVRGGGGFCLRAGEAPATHSTPVPTLTSAQITATAEALAPTATAGPSAVPTQAGGLVVASITGSCEESSPGVLTGFLTVTFTITNQSTTASITAQPTISGGQPINAVTVPAGQSEVVTSTLQPGYIPGGVAQVFVDQTAVSGQHVTSNCAPA